MEYYNNDVKKIIEDLIRPYMNGECYETRNPYCRPYVYQALIFLRNNFYPEVKDWIDVDKKF